MLHRWIRYAMVAVFAVVCPASADSLEVPDCVEVLKSAPYVAYGHNHIVRVHNRCEEPVRCELSTDATPAPQRLEVPPGESREVLTRRGSPSSEFEVRIDCEETQ